MSFITAEDILKEYKARYLTAAPILILAPTQRCGSTLLQRAINSGTEATIYGENFFLAEKLSSLIVGPLREFETKYKVTKSTASSFYEGNTGIDATALFPDYALYCRTLLQQFYAIIDLYQNDAAQHGRKRWGLKHQIVNAQHFNHFLQLIPKPRIVIVYRNVVDAAKSHKARWPKQLETEQQLQDYGLRWTRNMEYLMQIKLEKLMIRYETMSQDPAPIIQQLQDFVGVKVDESVFGRRVNAHFSKKDVKGGVLHIPSEGHYVAPAALSDSEQAALLTHSATLMQKLQY